MENVGQEKSLGVVTNLLIVNIYAPFFLYKSNGKKSLVHEVWIRLSWNRDDAMMLKVN